MISGTLLGVVALVVGVTIAALIVALDHALSNGDAWDWDA